MKRNHSILPVLIIAIKEAAERRGNRRSLIFLADLISIATGEDVELDYFLDNDLRELKDHLTAASFELIEAWINEMNPVA